LKPANIESLNEVITTAKFHPTHGHLFALGTSRGEVRLCDLRDAALCDSASSDRLVFRSEGTGSTPVTSFFSELVRTVSDVAFTPDGRHMFTRDYMSVRLWDLAMNRQPISILPIHDVIRPRLCDLYENDAIFDRFETAVSHDGNILASGSYSNFVRLANGFSSKGTVSTELIHADKSILRSVKSNSGSRSKSKNSLHLSSLFCSKSLDEMAPKDLNFDRKALHLVFHPRENTLAVAAQSNLFLFTTTTSGGSNSSTSSSSNSHSNISSSCSSASSAIG